MPELPEVEIAARNLRRWMARRRIGALRADARARRLFRPGTPVGLQALAGARFQTLRRIGKNLLLTFAEKNGKLGVWSHLGMTGKWLRRAPGEPAPSASRVELTLDDGVHVHYVDRRMFGRFRLVPDAQFEQLPEIAALGPDPLTDGIDAAALRTRLAGLRTPIKVALLDQTILAGVGNIQASESLFRAGIDPRRPARTLTGAEVGRLAAAILESIHFTLDDFVAAGRGGGDADIGYVEEHQTENPFLVYGRAGAPCPRCKKGTIVRMVQAQRATFFCPRCQK
jgi:formamidopyrimidine-DNA glycosylase